MTHRVRVSLAPLPDALSSPNADNGEVIEGDSSGSDRVTKLVELGRDREAADLATNTQGELMDALAQLDQLGPLLGEVVSGITSDQLDNKTPCSEFTVRGVLEHMIGGATQFTAAFSGKEAGQPDTTDVLGSFGPTLTALAESMHGPGALDQTINAPFGEVPADTFARFVVLDGLVHGWDMATATGQAYAPSDALVEAVTEFASGAIPPLRDGVTFGPAVEPSPDATPIERLAALTGRQLVNQ